MLQPSFQFWTGAQKTLLRPYHAEVTDEELKSLLHNLHPRFTYKILEYFSAAVPGIWLILFNVKSMTRLNALHRACVFVLLYVLLNCCIYFHLTDYVTLLISHEKGLQYNIFCIYFMTTKISILINRITHVFTACYMQKLHPSYFCLNTIDFLKNLNLN